MTRDHFPALLGATAATLAKVLHFLDHPAECLILRCLLLVFTIICLLETAQEHGQEEVEQDQIQHDVKNWEENQSDGSRDSIMIVHYSLPVLSDEYYENRRESHVK